MAQHDRYETDILKQLTRIANALKGIEKKLPNYLISDHMRSDELISFSKPIREGKD